MGGEADVSAIVIDHRLSALDHHTVIYGFQGMVMRGCYRIKLTGQETGRMDIRSRRDIHVILLLGNLALPGIGCAYTCSGSVSAADLSHWNGYGAPAERDATRHIIMHLCPGARTRVHEQTHCIGLFSV